MMAMFPYGLSTRSTSPGPDRQLARCHGPDLLLARSPDGHALLRFAWSPVGLELRRFATQAS